MRSHRRQIRLKSIPGSLGTVDSILGASNQNGNLADAGWPAAAGLSWAALLIGLMPVVTAFVRGTTWGVEPTVGLVLSCLGIAGLGRHYACVIRDWAQRRASRRRQTPEV